MYDFFAVYLQVYIRYTPRFLHTLGPSSGVSRVITNFQVLLCWLVLSLTGVSDWCLTAI